MKKISKKLISSVILSLIMYAPVNNVYAATLVGGPIFGKNDIESLGDDSYDSYRTESNGVFTYDFQGDSQLNITAKDTTKYNGIYIMTDNKNSVKTININDKLDIILEKDHTKASLSGIIVSNVLSDKTIDRSAGGDITINIYNDETFGGPVISGAEISGLSNNKILLGDANITLNATNVKYGMSLHGLYVTNGNSNQINMGNGEIKITGNVKSESTNSATAEAYGMRVSGLGNTILTEDVSVDVNITGDQNTNLTMVSGINVMSGGKFDTGTGYETDAIAACVVGGISFSGGIGKISGAVFGAIVFTAMTYALTFLGINPYYQYLLRGIVIIAAVALDCLKYLKKK